jgi:hypothetical protein
LGRWQASYWHQGVWHVATDTFPTKSDPLAFLATKETDILRGEWTTGEAWLGYQFTEHELIQVASLRPKGIPGFLYWKMLQPVHRRVFQAPARHRVKRAA